MAVKILLYIFRANLMLGHQPPIKNERDKQLILKNDSTSVSTSFAMRSWLRVLLLWMETRRKTRPHATPRNSSTGRVTMLGLSRVAFLLELATNLCKVLQCLEKAPESRKAPC